MGNGGCIFKHEQVHINSLSTEEKKDEFANSLDLDEVAHLSHLI